MTKQVTVVMPNYNCLAYLPKAIDSVLLQKDVLLELMIIDDGSTDGSVEWLEQAEQRYNQIRLIKQPNQGVIAARNKAIKKAQGDYIAFLDADDYWYPDKLKAQLDFMLDNTDCGLTFTNYQHIDMNYHPIIDCFAYWPEFHHLCEKHNKAYKLINDPVNLLLIANVIGTSSVMVKKETIIQAGGFDPSLRSASDWDCWLRMALISDVGFSEAVTMDYLMRPNSITANKQNRLEAMAEITERIGSLDLIKQSTRLKANARLLESYGEMHREAGEFYKACQYSFKAFRASPNKRHLKHLCSDIKQMTKLTLQLRTC